MRGGNNVDTPYVDSGGGITLTQKIGNFLDLTMGKLGTFLKIWALGLIFVEKMQKNDIFGSEAPWWPPEAVGEGGRGWVGNQQPPTLTQHSQIIVRS